MRNEEHTQDEESWPALPTETEIYILPDGEIVIADLPAELAAAINHLIQQQTAESTEELSDNTEPSLNNHVSD